MDAKIKHQWIKAIRSGKYKQGQGALRDENDKYCCLGVLCDLYCKAKKVKWSLSSGFGSRSYNVYQENGILPPQVIKWAKLEEGNPIVKFKGKNDNLANLNDNGKRFSTIANVIEKSL